MNGINKNDRVLRILDHSNYISHGQGTCTYVQAPHLNSIYQANSSEQGDGPSPCASNIVKALSSLKLYPSINIIIRDFTNRISI